MVFDKFRQKNGKYGYFVFRVLVGFLFMLHGAQKLFGVFGRETPVDLFSQMGVAGVIEFVGGVFLIFGIFTQWTSVIAGVEMLFAYFMAHAPKALLPIQNGGEASLMFFAAFIVLFVYGAGIWAVDNLFRKKRK